MRTEYKHNPPIPYSLHDMRVKKIIIQDKTIVLEFEDGYEKLTEPFEQVEGNITIEGVDFDCTCVMLQSKWGNYGKFNGEKLELERFIKRYKNYSFEIVDELYGYNQVLYSGYLSILETEDLVQMDISIYFTGKIIYDTKEYQILIFNFTSWNYSLLSIHIKTFLQLGQCHAGLSITDVFRLMLFCVKKPFIPVFQFFSSSEVNSYQCPPPCPIP